MALPGVCQFRQFRHASFHRLTLGLIIEETVDLGGGTVVGADGEALVGTVKDQVLAHDGQTDEAEISTRGRAHRSTDIDAGEAGANVSCPFMSTMWVVAGRGGCWAYSPRHTRTFVVSGGMVLNDRR